jgi:single-stranded DNA-specific DHH superfamily exonuclease
LDDAKKEAVLQVNKIRKKIEAKLQNELERQETKYDKKTNHGLITVYQKKYNKRFKKLRQ